MRIGVSTISSWLLAVPLLLLAACGGGGVRLPTFVQGVVVGPGGGTVQTVTVRLDVPPGAFTEDHVIVILPQPDPLPIDPLAGDVEYMPGIMCIGPIGQPLLVDGHLRMCYSPADIPAGSTEADLVLLEWDDAAGFMRISTDAVQDLINHCFDDDHYTELGHVAIGVIATQPLFVYLNDSADQSVQGLPTVSTRGLGWGFRNHGIRDDLSVTLIDNTAGAGAFLPSIGGQRVLFTVSDPFTESTFLHTVDLDPAGGFPARQLSDSTTTSLFDPLYGWLESGDDNVFVERRPFLVQEAGNVPLRSFERMSATGAPPPTTWNYLHPNSFSFLDDVRQSPDGSLTLLRYINFGEGSYSSYDVVQNASGLSLATDILQNRFETFLPTPRWLPDSSGLYYVDSNGRDVRAVDADGSNDRLLYTLGDVSEVIVEFVVSPDYVGADLSNSHCAYVERDFELQDDSLVMDTLSGDGPSPTSLGGEFFVNEMAWRPDGAGVILDLDTGRKVITEIVVIPSSTRFLHFADATGAELRRIFATMDDLDVDRDTNEMLLWISTSTQDLAFDQSGIYLLGFGAESDFLAVEGDGAIAPVRAVGPARFLHSWRRAPGFSGSGEIR